jgi:hypothetical protein
MHRCNGLTEWSLARSITVKTFQPRRLSYLSRFIALPNATDFPVSAAPTPDRHHTP